MKKLTLLSVTAGSLTALLAIGMSATSLA
ncbi:ATPase, partial [Vibrio parahaemolyticus]